MGVLEGVHFRTLCPGDEEDFEVFLRPRLTASMFLLGNARAAGLRDDGRVLQGSYVGAFEGEQLVAVAAHYWNGNLILQAPVHEVEVGRAALRASGRALKGVLGPDVQVEAFLAPLELPHAAFQTDETEKLYDLPLSELIVPPESESARQARPGDLEILSRWRVAYVLETLNETETPELWASCRESAERAQRSGQLWLLEVGGEPVSCSAFNSRTPEAVQVGGVYTPPEYRGRGYARAVVAASLLEARASGATQAVLFTPLSNRAAQRAYEALGFRPQGHYRVALFGRPLAL